MNQLQMFDYEILGEGRFFTKCVTLNRIFL